jgi:hypothetical protein
VFCTKIKSRIGFSSVLNLSVFKIRFEKYKSKIIKKIMY